MRQKQPETAVLRHGPVELRSVTPQDAPWYARWMQDAFITENYGGADVVFTEEMAHGFFSGRQGKPSFLIFRAQGGPALGFCELTALDDATKSACLAMFIGQESARGQGLGTAALHTLLEYGFHTLKLHSIWLSVWAGNAPALALYRRAGFREFGRRRDAWRYRGMLYDLVYMDLLAEEFDAHARAGPCSP